MHKPTLTALMVLAGNGCAPEFDPRPVVTGADLDTPFVRAEGTRLVERTSEGDRELTVRAVNLGGWLQWEGWMWGAGLQSETEMRAKLSELVGDTEMERFAERVHREFITEKDIEAIAELGFNAVRVPFNHTLLADDDAPYTIKPGGFAILDDVVRWCGAHGIYALLDLHVVPGGQSWTYMTDPDWRTDVWHHESARERTVWLWREIAERYASEPAVLGYDLINEPYPTSGDDLFDLYVRITEEITRVDPRHMIMLQGQMFASDFSLFHQRVRDNQAYTFHLYSLGDAPEGDVERMRDASLAHDMPMWNGEIGENQVSSLEQTVGLFEEHHLSGFGFWTWKRTFDNTASLAELKDARMPLWVKTAEWVQHGVTAKPTRAEALRGFDEMLDASRVENLRRFDELPEALLR